MTRLKGSRDKFFGEKISKTEPVLYNVSQGWGDFSMDFVWSEPFSDAKFAKGSTSNALLSIRDAHREMDRNRFTCADSARLAPDDSAKAPSQ